MTQLRFRARNPVKLSIILIVLAIVAKALLIFAGISLFQALSSAKDYQADLFPDQYDLIAMNLVEGHGYRFFPETTLTTIRTPGFVVFLAGIFWFFGKSLVAVKIVNILLSMATAYLTYRLSVRLTNNSWIGCVAAIFCFFFPGSIVADGRGGFESLFTFGIVLFMLLVYRAIETRRAIEYGAAGVCFGALMMIRSTVGLFPVALALYLLVEASPVFTRPMRLSRLAVFAACGALVMSPWIIRNAELTGRFIPTMSVSGLAAFEGDYVVEHRRQDREFSQLLWDAEAEQNRIATDMGLKFTTEGVPFFPQFYSIQDELSYYDHLSAIVYQDYWTHPTKLLKTTAFNAVAFWIQGRSSKATMYNIVLSGPLFLLGIIGAAMAARRGYRTAPLLLFIGTCYVSHLPILAVARYWIPLVPLISILAAIPIVQLISSRGRARVAPGLGA